MAGSEPSPGVLVAPDAFKGTMSAFEVCAALAAGVEEAGGRADRCPVADGGEGTAEIVGRALGAEPREAEVADPLGRPTAASFWLAGEVAYLDLAAASGLSLLGEAERDPLRADTAGTGELALAARRAGATRLVLAAGGSATVDGGLGAVEAIAAGGGLAGCELTVLCDVQTPFELAPRIFGPQKGASPADVATLERRLEALAARLPADPRGRPMTGAAGGFAGGLWAALGAELRPGAPYVLDLLGFDARLAAADAVLFGEGQLDQQSFLGKIGGEVVRRAAVAGVPAYAVVGRSRLSPREAEQRGIAAVVEAGDPAALQRAAASIAARL